MPSLLAPFTLVFACQFPASFSVWISWRWRGVKFRSNADPPLEGVSGPYYWSTEPVWMDKPASRIEGVSIGWSVNCTGPSLNLIQRNVPQSNVTCPNKINVVIVFGNILGKKYRRYMWSSACPPACPTYRFVFKAEMLCSVWITIGRELANRRSGVYASSRVWMGLLINSTVSLSH